MNLESFWNVTSWNCSVLIEKATDGAPESVIYESVKNTDCVKRVLDTDSCETFTVLSRFCRFTIVCPSHTQF